jgi:hypothetical protein
MAVNGQPKKGMLDAIHCSKISSGIFGKRSCGFIAFYNNEFSGLAAGTTG